MPDDRELEALVAELKAKGTSPAVIASVIDQWDDEGLPDTPQAPPSPAAGKSLGGFAGNVASDIGANLSALLPWNWPGMVVEGGKGQQAAGEQFTEDVLRRKGGVGIDPARWAAQGQQAVETLYEQPVSAALSVAGAVPGVPQAMLSAARTGTAAGVRGAAAAAPTVGAGIGGVTGFKFGGPYGVYPGIVGGRRLGQVAGRQLRRGAEAIRPRPVPPEPPVAPPPASTLFDEALRKRREANPDFWAEQGPLVRTPWDPRAQTPPGTPPAPPGASPAGAPVVPPSAGTPPPQGPTVVPPAAGPPRPPAAPGGPPVVGPPVDPPPIVPPPPAGAQGPSGGLAAERPPAAAQHAPPPRPQAGPASLDDPLFQQELGRVRATHAEELAAANAKAESLAEAIGYLIDNKVSPDALAQVNLGEFGGFGFRDLFDYGRQLAKETGNARLIEVLSRGSQRLHQTATKLGRPRISTKKKGS